MPVGDHGYRPLAVGSWTDFLAESEASDHAVQVYTDIEELAETASAYLAVGFDRGDPAIVVVTPEHWSSFAAGLKARGWSAARIEREGLLFLEDAEAMLTTMTTDAAISWESFEAAIGSIVDRVASRFPDGRIRAVGAMVDILCRRGDATAAATLEEHWNRLQETRQLSLLCSYRVDPFDRSAQVSVLPAVCRAHSHVLPAHDPIRFRGAVDTALEESLGRDAGKVYALVGDQARASNVPEAQLALMWVSEHMPASAERILAAARTHYTAPPTGVSAA